MKKWKQTWKIKLIEEFNPDWEDLAEEQINYVELIPSVFGSCVIRYAHEG